MSNRIEGLLESLVFTLAAGVMMLPLVILGMIPISIEAKMMLVVMLGIPYGIIYLKVMFRVTEWEDDRDRHKRLSE